MKTSVQHLLISALGGGIGILLLGLLLSMPGAQLLPAQAQEPVDVSAQSVAVLTDRFDGAWTSSIQRTITSTNDYLWGRVITSTTGFADTLWCVQDGSGISLTAGIDTYTNGVNTTLTYGPINFQSMTAAELSFQSWISVASGDGLEWGYSTDGTLFTFNSVNASTMGAWQTTIVNSVTDSNFRTLLGQRTVYLAFRFSSNADDLVDLGVFLDNIQLNAAYHVHAYMPVVFRDKFFGYEIFEDFSDWSVGWQYGSRRKLNADGTVSEEYSFGYKQDWDGHTARFTEPNIYYIWVRDDNDHVFLTAPTKIATRQNFVFDASLRSVKTPKLDGEEYGILISANPISATKQVSSLVYTLQVRMFPNGKRQALAKKWVLTKHGSRTAYDLMDPVTNNTHITADNDVWNRFRITRIGDVLSFAITAEEKWNEYSTILTIEDDSLPEIMYVGFYAARVDLYSQEMEYQFDDIYIKATPW